ncbi:MAG: hypothetical protein ACJZ4X_02385 [Candidatus Thalassarchaeaceae archaeon]
MRRILAIILVVVLSGQVAAHGANSYAIIVRTSSVQPESADLLVNDTLVLYNTVTWNRSAGIDVNGDGVDDYTCEMTGKNTSSNTDECQFTFENGTWNPGGYVVTVYQNGSSWQDVVVDLLPDNHTEGSVPGPYVLLPDFDPSADNMVSISEEGGQFSLSKASINLVPGSNLYVFSSTQTMVSVEAATAGDGSSALCAIGGSGDGGCKIWFSGQEWADGSHEMVVIGPDGDVVESFTVNLGEASSGDARTGMVQIIALMGMVICLGAYLWLRQRKE